MIAIEAPRVALIGIPTDSNSSFRRGPAKGPARIRGILDSAVGNSATESGWELGRDIAFSDAGTVEIREEPGDAERIKDAIAAIAGTGAVPLAIGGDHSVTVPIVAALAARHGPLQILHIDAHPDLYDDFDGNPNSHASPFARIMERGLASRLVQIGIRTLNHPQRGQAIRFGVEIVPMRDFDPKSVPVLAGPLYVSIDLDGFDPAYAPGVSHHEPGGLSPRQVLDVLHAQTACLVGGDVVELNPDYDPNDLTAALAAKMIRELAGLAHRRPVPR